MAERDAVALYESLARFQWWRARRGVAVDALDGLEIRKRLLAPGDADGPADGGAGLDAWLRERIGGFDGRRVLDLGCGFGASSFRALDAGARSTFGVTPSAFQVQKASEVAAARGVADRCRFEVRPMEDSLPSADIVLAIEALGHTPQLGSVLQHVAQCLAEVPEGRFVWLEDLLRERPGEDPDVRGLADAWCSPPLRTVAESDDALCAAGLAVVDEVDLSSQVPRRDGATIDRSLRRMRRLLRFTPVPFARRILRAFAGGLHLERLYARELACYRLVMTQRKRDALA